MLPVNAHDRPYLILYMLMTVDYGADHDFFEGITLIEFLHDCFCRTPASPAGQAPLGTDSTAASFCHEPETYGATGSETMLCIPFRPRRNPEIIHWNLYMLPAAFGADDWAWFDRLSVSPEFTNELYEERYLRRAARKIVINLHKLIKFPCTALEFQFV
jgi:hypothetical protein